MYASFHINIVFLCSQKFTIHNLLQVKRCRSWSWLWRTPRCSPSWRSVLSGTTPYASPWRPATCAPRRGLFSSACWRGCLPPCSPGKALPPQNNTHTTAYKNHIYTLSHSLSHPEFDANNRQKLFRQKNQPWLFKRSSSFATPVHNAPST